VARGAARRMALLLSVVTTSFALFATIAVTTSSTRWGSGADAAGAASLSTVKGEVRRGMVLLEAQVEVQVEVEGDETRGANNGAAGATRGGGSGGVSFDSRRQLNASSGGTSLDSRRQLSALQPISDDSGGSNNGGGVVQVTGSGSREKGPAAVAKPPPLSTERITRRVKKGRGRKEVDYDALVGGATDDSVEVKLPESPGDGQVPSWHPSRRKRKVSEQKGGRGEGSDGA